jgi:hypothetical protein
MIQQENIPKYLKRFLDNVFKLSGAKSLYFSARNKDEMAVECPILVYHSIGDAPGSLSPQLLDKHIDFLSSRFTIIPLKKLYSGIVNGNLSKNPLVITFDDGYKNIYELALPILKKYQVTASIFIITGYLEHKSFMTQEQIKELALYGMEIGAHSVTHPNLRRLKPRELKSELQSAKTKLEDITKSEVISLAYPYGLYNRQVIEVAQQVGFKIAVTGVHDFFVNPWKLFECPRIAVCFHDSCEDLLAKLNGDQHWLKLVQKCLNIVK